MAFSRGHWGRSAAVALALLAGACVSEADPVPIEEETRVFEDDVTGAAFVFPGNWVVKRVSHARSKLSLFEFRFDAFPYRHVGVSQKPLWESTRCLLFIEPTTYRGAGLRAAKDQAWADLKRTLKSNLPEKRRPAVVAFNDAALDKSALPSALARLEGRYSVPVTVKARHSSGGSLVEIAKEERGWMSFGQVMLVGGTRSFLTCKGQDRFANQFTALGDLVAKSLIIP